jgi:folate-binding protein YgfZ
MLLSRLDRSIFTEDVRVVDRVELTSIGVYGPHAVSMVSSALAASDAQASPDDPVPEGPMGAWREYQHRQYLVDGKPIVVMRDDEPGTGGYALWLSLEHAAAFKDSFRTFGALEMSPETADTLRIEAGRPRWGSELDEDTIPLEAGIEDRAISFTKGCYVGQEVIVRILHRGHGRVARRLVGLTVAAEAAVARNAAVHAGETEAGRVTSAAMSPTAGSIALAYVHREFAVPGTPLSIAVNSDRLSALVVALPFVAPGGPSEAA